MLRRIAGLIFLVSGLLTTAAPARAQGCIMCYTSALAAGKGVQDALRNGVLLLLIPVALLLIATAVTVWRKSIPAADPQ
jgi:hypothetical protein